MNFQEFEEIFKDCEIDGDKVLLKSPMHDAVRFVKETYGFNMLKEIIAADKGEGETELIYHLYSVEDEEDLYMSAIVKDEAASVTDLYDSAKADENEIFDMFGIRFIGNENLKRLYMPEDWKGSPLRKDYIQDDTRLAWDDRT